MSNSNWSRRNFIKTTAVAGGVASALPSFAVNSNNTVVSKNIVIAKTNSNFEREPLLRPFGFKGAFMSEIWQNIAFLESSSGIRKVGLGSQNVLWSDASVFGNFSESGGNAFMYVITEYALNLIKGASFQSPVNLLDDILEDVYAYGKKITNNPNLRKTFVLNALVSVDNAAWLLYAAENNITTFDDLIPEKYRPALSHHLKGVASVPSMAFTIPISEIKQAADEGYFFMKIKIGHPGTEKEMLEKDMARISEIHKTLGNYRTKYSADGKLPYYIDINGRYQKKETLLRLIDHIEKIGAFDQTVIIEEPFPEHLEIDVSDVPIRLAADESAHTDKDALERIQMGYKGIALKAIAKTLSMTLKIANVAKQQNVPCFCADLTVNPILIDWNKNIAARLEPFPGLDIGLMETNGHQNYSNWTKMETYHPFADAEWRKSKKGVFELDKDYYAKSGGVLIDSKHYMDMF